MPTPSPRNRQGALPLHLTLAMLPWLASLTALPLSKNGLSDLKMSPLAPNLPPAAAKLKDAWHGLLADPKLAAAVEQESRKRAAEFLEGLRQYQEADFTRDVEEQATVFSRGSARLLSYGGDSDAPAILLIPSLINRYYILDLTERLSFARYLRSRGFNVFVVDWGAPTAVERSFNCALFITETLIPMAEWVRAHNSGPMITTGYCMGGLLTLALAQIRPDLVDAAAFLATPWDFSVPDFPRFALKAADIEAMEKYINGCDMLSAETIHTLFHCANPLAFQSKLREFARMDKSRPSTQEFLAIEHWVNDGVPMTRGVAHDCLIGWMQRNTTASGEWRVGGQIVNPAKIHAPCFVAVPQDDRIVPAACALPLAGLLKATTLITPHSGHVGMMVGGRRKAALWEPFAQWVYSQFT
jgi:poly(3-hydroxyalkanoate) synthetase